MIPFIRSLNELIVITESRAKQINQNKEIGREMQLSIVDSGQRKRYIRSIDEKEINLPEIPKRTRRKWIKGKEAISKFFDELDYNNQIQSSYDLTLLARQNKSKNQDAA